jgi:ABC-2 type transport system ATP-binding protein
VRHLVADLAGDGATVLVSSHLLAEVEQICTHIGVMHTGRLLAQGTISELRDKTAPAVRIETDDPERAIEVLRGLGVGDPGLRPDSHPPAGRTVVTGALGTVAIQAIVPALVAGGVAVYAFGADAPSLEDVFVGLTGEGFDVSG